MWCTKIRKTRTSENHVLSLWRYFELPYVTFDSQLYNLVVSEGETVNTLGPQSQRALTTPAWPCHPGGSLPRREGATPQQKAIASALEISHKGDGMPNSCTGSPLGMRTPEPVGTCHDPLLCWFSEAPEAMKSV